MNSLKNLDDVIVKFIYESSQALPFKTKINVALETIINYYIASTKKNINSLAFVCGGRQLRDEDFKKPLGQIMNFANKEEKSISILVLNMEESEDNITNKDNIFIVIIDYYQKHFKLRGKKGESIKNIIQREKPQFIKLAFNYNNNIIDINKKFEDIANQKDKEDKLIILTINYIKINFINDKIGNKKMLFLPDIKLVDACKKYCNDNNLNFNDLIFDLDEREIDFNDTTNNNNITIYETMHNLINHLNNNNSMFNDNRINEINIKVKERNQISFCKKYKKLIIIISSIIGALIIVGAIVLIVLLTKSKDKKKNTYQYIEEESSETTRITQTPTNIIKKTDEPNDINRKTNEPDEEIKKTEQPTHINDKPNESNIILGQKKECDSGYYIPDDDPNLKDCQKCSIEGCIKCSGTYNNNICTDCGSLISVLEKGKIIKCNAPSKNKISCEIGEEDKCLTCVENKNECKTCNIAYKLVEGKCKPDFFMKAVYLTKQDDDKIDIISSYSIVEHIITEGNKTKMSSTSYQFKKAGYNTVYFQFQNSYYFHSSIFSRIRHLKSIFVSDFDEYYMTMSLDSMFYGCTNLTSVDFSKLSYKYSSNLEHFLNGCINLTYVNLKNLKAGSSTSYMFNDCKLLTSVDLSNIDISSTETLNNMFANCTSLQNVNLKGFKLDSATTISSIFNNCYSLKSLDFSALKPTRLTKVYYAFYNCSSLTSINFLDFYSELTDMNSLFYNCSSLKQLNLFDFNTKNVENMNNLFYGCKSLTSIIFGPNFVMDNVKYIGSMFAHCHSLKSVNIELKITRKISSLYSLFSDCYSLTSINLKNFDTSNVNDYNNMFHNCYNLTNIDISNFKFNTNVNIKNMFSGCYSLTSMDFSKNEPNYCQFDEIFYDCPNLKYLNFSFLHYVRYYSTVNYYIFNENISSSGTLILNKDYYNDFLQNIKYIPPEGWNLILE